MRWSFPWFCAASLFTLPALAQPVGAPPPGPGGYPAPAPNAAPEPAPDATPWPMSQGNRAGLQFDFWPSQLDFGPISISIYEFVWCPLAQIQLVKNVFLDAEIPFAFISASSDAPSSSTGDDSNSAFAFGEPTIGAHYGANVTPQLAFFVGGSVSIPTLNDPSDDTEAAAIYAGLSRADFDSHRFFVRHMPIRARGGIEFRILPELYYRGDLAPVFAIPFDQEIGVGKVNHADPEFFIDQGNEIEYRVQSGFGAGFRLQEVFELTEKDRIQTAAEPFIGYEPPEPGVYARLGFLVALDKRDGFGFDHGKVASLRTSVGGKW